MLTIAEAVETVARTYADAKDEPAKESYNELQKDPQVLMYALILADLQTGRNSAVLHALCLGIMAGIESERGKKRDWPR